MRHLRPNLRVQRQWLVALLVLAALCASAGPASSAPAESRPAQPQPDLTYRLTDDLADEPWQLQAGHYGATADISSGPDGTVYVLDERHQVLHTTALDGTPTGLIELPDTGLVGDLLWTASRIDVATDGSVLVLLSGVPRRTFGPARVDVLNAAGERYQSFTIEPTSGAYTDIAAGPGGTVYLSRASVGGIFDPGGEAAIDVFNYQGQNVATIVDPRLTYPTGVDVATNGLVYVINRVPSPGGALPPGPTATPEPSSRRDRAGEPGRSDAEYDAQSLQQDPPAVEGIIIFTAGHAYQSTVPFSNAEDIGVGPAGVFIARQLEIFRLAEREPIFAGPTGRVVSSYFGRTVFHLDVPFAGGLLASVNHCYTQGVAVLTDPAVSPVGASLVGDLDGPELEGPAFPLRVAADGWLAVMGGRYDIDGYRPGHSYLVGPYSYEIQTVQRWVSGSLLGQLGLCSGRESSWVKDIALSGDTVITVDPSIVQGRPDDGFPAWRYWPGELSFPDGVSLLTAVDAEGQTVAVLDAGARRVVMMSPTGSATGWWMIGQDEAAPTDIAVVGDAVALASGGARHVGVYGLDGTRRSEFPTHDEPVAIAGGEGDVFVLGGNGWGYRYGLDGGLVASWRLPSERARPLDIAVDTSGKVYVNYLSWTPEDNESYRISQAGVWVFEPIAREPVAPPAPDACVAAPDKTAAPDVLPLGSEVEVTLTVDGRCPGTQDALQLALVVDNSRSMNFEEARERVVSDALELFQAVDPDRTEVALVTFDDDSGLIEPLTRDTNLVSERVVALEPWGGTAMGAGIDTATAELTGPRGNPAVRRAIVIMSDGVVNDDPIPAAMAAAAAGIELHVLVYPTREYYIVDPTVLEAVAGTPDRVVVDPAPGDLRALARVLAGATDNPNLFRSITVTDQIPSNMTYLDRSANPPAALVGDRLVWTLTDVEAFAGITLSYLLVPQQVGLWPTNVRADADFVDDLGNPGQLVFPIPYVRVWDSASMPHHIYLPATFGRGCVPLPQPLDVVLILDTSSSMSEPAFADPADGTKLDAAIKAIDDFVRLMRREDWAALVAFDAEARIELPLTPDRAAFTSALDRLTQHEGTQIDDGLVAAGLVLEERRADARPAVVLLTDGRHAGESDEVLVAASEIKRSGVTLITIGLGENVDHTLLRSVASSSGLYYPAPTAADLADIYAAISALLPCAP